MALASQISEQLARIGPVCGAQTLLGRFLGQVSQQPVRVGLIFWSRTLDARSQRSGLSLFELFARRPKGVCVGLSYTDIHIPCISPTARPPPDKGGRRHPGASPFYPATPSLLYGVLLAPPAPPSRCFWKSPQKTTLEESEFSVRSLILLAFRRSRGILGDQKIVKEPGQWDQKSRVGKGDLRGRFFDHFWCILYNFQNAK